MRSGAWRRVVLATCVGGLVLASAGDQRLAAQRDAHGLLSPETARRLSYYGTMVPMAAGSLAARSGNAPAAAGLGLGGLILGPALGYAYAGEGGHGLMRAGLRAAALAGGFAGATGLCELARCGLPFFEEDSGALWPSLGVILAGVVVASYIAAVDVARVEGVVREKNAERPRVAVLPVHVPASGSVGAGVVWRW